MPSAAPEIRFEPRPRRIGMQWRVVATYANGQKGQITGFASEAEAVAWLASDACEAWRMARLIARGDE